MSNLNDEYQKIMRDIEKNITNPEQLQYVKDKIAKLTMLFMNTVDKVVEYSDEKLSNMEEKQEDLEERLSKIQKSLDNIEKDIYEDENEFEFEVVCPYCNHQFVTDIDLEENSELQCPECKNMIELDWNEEDDECTGHCHSCLGCEEHEDDEFDEEDLEEDEEDSDDDDM